MEFLPIDYYILLQVGFDKKRTPVAPSNHVFYTNLPLLNKKRSYLQEKTEIVKNVTFEDVMRCLDKQEVAQMLADPFAEQELLAHLQSRFGPVRELFHVNYNPKDIVARFAAGGRGVGSD